MAYHVNKELPVRGIAAQTGSQKMSHLEDIAVRQRKSLVRDALFVVCLAFAAVVSVSSVGKAVQASSTGVHGNAPALVAHG